MARMNGDITARPARKKDELAVERIIMEKELRESEDKFFKAFQAVPALLSISSLADGRYIEVNEALEKTLGYRREEIIGRTATEIGIWENPAERDRLVRLLREGTRVRDVEVRLRSGTGEVIIGSLSAEIINVQGEECLIALTRDITAVKRAEDALRESEKLFRATFNQAAVGIAHTGLNGRWLRVNQKFCEILGYSEEELMGLDIRAITHPDDLATSATYLQLLLDGKLENYSLEKRYLRKDGSTVWVNITVSMVHDRYGRNLFHVGVVEDITARKKTEADLRESEKRYRSLFENMLEGFAYCKMLFDHQGSPEDFIFIDVNSAFIRLTGLADVVDKKATEAIPGIKEAHPELFEVYGRVASTGIPETFEIEFEPLGIWLFVTAYSMQREYFVAVFDNITERKRAAEEIEILNTDLAARAVDLENANRELEAFSYSASHDLRKPLTIINGYCQVIQELCGIRLDEQCRQYLQEIYDGTMRMNELIDSLLKFSCVTRNELHRETVDLSGIAKAVAAELGLTEPGRRVIFQIAEGMYATGDKNLLRAVLENLLGNAWKYTSVREKAVIEFGVTDIDGKRAWFVRDNGTGFAMADADKLFLPFQRLAGTEDLEGHGIGLATVERIIRRHGGKIWAEGEPGTGATFWFTLQ